jgi:hypothetical protein
MKFAKVIRLRDFKKTAQMRSQVLLEGVRRVADSILVNFSILYDNGGDISVYSITDDDIDRFSRALANVMSNGVTLSEIEGARRSDIYFTVIPQNLFDQHIDDIIQEGNTELWNAIDGVIERCYRSFADMAVADSPGLEGEGDQVTSLINRLAEDYICGSYHTVNGDEFEVSETSRNQMVAQVCSWITNNVSFQDAYDQRTTLYELATNGEHVERRNNEELYDGVDTFLREAYRVAEGESSSEENGNVKSSGITSNIEFEHFMVDMFESLDGIPHDGGELDMSDVYWMVREVKQLLDRGVRGEELRSMSHEMAGHFSTNSGVRDDIEFIINEALDDIATRVYELETFGTDVSTPEGIARYMLNEDAPNDPIERSEWLHERVDDAFEKFTGNVADYAQVQRMRHSYFPGWRRPAFKDFVDELQRLERSGLAYEPDGPIGRARWLLRFQQKSIPEIIRHIKENNYQPDEKYLDWKWEEEDMRAFVSYLEQNDLRDEDERNFPEDPIKAAVWMCKYHDDELEHEHWRTDDFLKKVDELGFEEALKFYREHPKLADYIHFYPASWKKRQYDYYKVMLKHVMEEGCDGVFV